MLHLRVICPADESASVVGFLGTEPGVAHVVVAEGVSRQPVGDVVEAVVARKAAEDVVRRLAEQGVSRRGQISLQSVDVLLSESAAAAERNAPGEDADAVIWEELVATTGEESRINPVYLGFLTIACLLAAAGVITDSAITLVGAMVVSPDFGPLAALAVAAVGRRRELAARAALALGVGYPLAMLVTAALTLVAHLGGLFEAGDLANLHEASFVYEVGPFSVIVALLAGVAGMIALTSAKPSTLVGVFISVTTVPAAGFAVLAAVAGDWGRCGEAALQLLINLSGVSVAATLTLLVRRKHVGPGPAPGRGAPEPAR
ncbi:DUF389 domain-containing protein [Streptomyces sp. TR06-5]|uniref:DUF389 domain-containing protein n=1 Tax=Streptomyces sp. TR06-5 TaxID=3385976 RepID=UPI0039A236FF